jgi:hypothetical protein
MFKNIRGEKMTKDEILSRRTARMQNISVLQINAKSELNSSLTLFLSPLDAWEMIKKISYEMYYMQTNIQPDTRLNKQVIHIFKRDL